MGVLIIALFVLGVLIVILNYADILPGGVNNLWLIAAIGCHLCRPDHGHPLPLTA